MSSVIDSSISKEIRILDPQVREHVDTFRVVMLSAAHHTVFPELLEIFGPELVMKFLDIFGGLTIKVPDRSFLEQATRDVDIFQMMSKSPDQEAAVDYLARKYDMIPDYVRECYDRVKKIRERYGLNGKHL